MGLPLINIIFCFLWFVISQYILVYWNIKNHINSEINREFLSFLCRWMLWLYKAVSACPCCSSHWSLMFNLESVNIMNYSESKCSTQKFVLSKRLSCNVFVDSCITYIERNHCLANLHRGNQCCSSSCCWRGSLEHTDQPMETFTDFESTKWTIKFKDSWNESWEQTYQATHDRCNATDLSDRQIVSLTSKILIPIFRVLLVGMCKIHLVGLMNQPGFHNLIKFGWFSPKNTG